MLIVFTATIFLSAFLVFLIQPMFARMALPLLGGAPAVWNTALVFYQAVLLGGYAYAHASTYRIRIRRQSGLHIALMFLPLLVLPIGLPAGWKPPAQANPTLWFLGLMAVAVGLPFFVVSAGSPLLQKWFANTQHKHSSDPYFLYAASNLGSLLALIAYPFLIEPNFHLHQQGWIWSLGYSLLVILMAACALFVWRSRLRFPIQTQSVQGNDQANAAEGSMSRQEPESTQVNPSAENPGLRRRLLWIALAFVPSSLMLSVTTYLTTDIAAMPLLWIIPLSIYLLTFILAFSRKQLLPHRWLIRGMPVFLLAVLVTLVTRRTTPMALVMPLHLLAFFIIAMVCHGRLAKSRPPAESLTRFYLYISLGGVLGGAFNSLLAPLIFNSIAEYPIVLVLACLILPWPSTKSWKSRQAILDLILPISLGLLTLILLLRLQGINPHIDILSASVVFGLPALICLAFSRRPIRLSIAVAALFLVSNFYVGSRGKVLYAERSFFGVSRISIDETEQFMQIFQGNTLHGRQYIAEALRREPLAYYHRTSPLGQFFSAMEESNRLKKVALVGLGSGGISCYSKPGQQWTYYEIDPVVARIAQDPRFFTFLKDSEAEIKIVLGDGRLSIQEAPDGAYDLFIMDAYNSDSLPAHLLSREALNLYLRKLAPKGILLFHISNRYLDIEPVLANLAHDAGLYCAVQNDKVVGMPGLDMGKISSKYAIMVRDIEDLGSLYFDSRWTPARRLDSVGIWTDSYSSILTILKWRR
jgi:spermidine synthase